MLACPLTPWFGYANPKKARKHSLSVNFHKFIVVSYCHADSIAVRSNHFLLVEWLFDAKVLPIGHAVTQNCVFVVFNQKQLKTIPTTNWLHMLYRQKSWKSLSNLEQTSTTWHKCLTKRFRSVTLIQSFLVITDFFLTVYLLVIFSMECLWLFSVSMKTRSDVDENRNKSCDGEHCFF